MAVESEPSTGDLTVAVETETIYLRCQADSLNHQLELLKVEVNETQDKLDRVSFSWERTKKSETSVRFYTGLPSVKIFKVLLSLFEDVKINYYYGWNVEKISKADQLFITLIKLRQNTPRYDLAIRFCCSVSTISNNVFTWIYFLHEILFKKLMHNIPSHKKNQACLPACFTDFSNCRMILHCTEIRIAVPKKMHAQHLSYNSYKHANTAKSLVCIDPNGVVTYVSALYPGGSSDKEIVEHCGILKHLHTDDLVMADKGFLLKDLLPESVSLNIPPFLSMPQFTPNEVMQTKSIARSRIHVERAIRQKKGFKILDMVPQTMRQHASVIFQTCAALTNIQYPLIAEVENLYKSVS